MEEGYNYKNDDHNNWLKRDPTIAHLMCMVILMEDDHNDKKDDHIDNVENDQYVLIVLINDDD